MKTTITFAELASWCNRTRPSAVARWCKNHGIRYMMDADGRPVTTRRAIDDAMGEARRTAPNWSV